jgi:hypothetical protein
MGDGGEEMKTTREIADEYLREEYGVSLEELDDGFTPNDNHAVYVIDADYVRLDLKATTAGRLVGWLEEFAEYADVAGHGKSAEHARRVAKRLEYGLEGDE